MKAVLIFLCLWATTLNFAQTRDTTIPIIISIPPDEYKIATLTDSIFGEPARVVFEVGVRFMYPLCDYTKEIKVTKVEIERLRIKLLNTDKQYDIRRWTRLSKDEQKIYDHFTPIFSYLFQHQPYEKMGDSRKSHYDGLIFGGSVNIVPPTPCSRE